MTARIITHESVREVSDREFFSRVFGHAPRTREQKQAEWNAKVEHYVSLILRGCEFSEYGNPAVREAKELIALRDAECAGDPLLEKRDRRVA